MVKGDALDPKGLISEAYKIEEITAPECRSIFLDWALSYEGVARDGISGLLQRYGHHEAHPMTLTLREGLSTPLTPKRRGGRRARVSDG